MKTDSASLIAALAEIAPSLNISTAWTSDPYFKWDGDGPDPKKHGYLPHDVEVTATVIHAGQMMEATDYLGGCYDKPGKLCPEIHGYWNQMADAAISELPEFPGKASALSLLHAARQVSYNQQRAEIEAGK